MQPNVLVFTDSILPHVPVLSLYFLNWNLNAELTKDQQWRWERTVGRFWMLLSSFFFFFILHTTTSIFSNVECNTDCSQLHHYHSLKFYVFPPLYDFVSVAVQNRYKHFCHFDTNWFVLSLHRPSLSCVMNSVYTVLVATFNLPCHCSNTEAVAGILWLPGPTQFHSAFVPHRSHVSLWFYNLTYTFQTKPQSTFAQLRQTVRRLHTQSCWGTHEATSYCTFCSFVTSAECKQMVYWRSKLLHTDTDALCTHMHTHAVCNRSACIIYFCVNETTVNVSH